MGFESLLTVHRLDRQTSGIVFFAKNSVAANDFRNAMEENVIQKVYFTRVQGDFRKCCKLEGGKYKAAVHK
jgi:23S rRNA pseudouridine955/2504/2580 synthase